MYSISLVVAILGIFKPVYKLTNSSLMTSPISSMDVLYSVSVFNAMVVQFSVNDFNVLLKCFLFATHCVSMCISLSFFAMFLEKFI